jgi:hypothetical protein
MTLQVKHSLLASEHRSTGVLELRMCTDVSEVRTASIIKAINETTRRYNPEG